MKDVRWPILRNDFFEWFRVLDVLLKGLDLCAAIIEDGRRAFGHFVYAHHAGSGFNQCSREPRSEESFVAGDEDALIFPECFIHAHLLIWAKITSFIYRINGFCSTLSKMSINVVNILTPNLITMSVKPFCHRFFS